MPFGKVWTHLSTGLDSNNSFFFKDSEWAIGPIEYE